MYIMERVPILGWKGYNYKNILKGGNLKEEYINTAYLREK